MASGAGGYLFYFNFFLRLAFSLDTGWKWRLSFEMKEETGQRQPWGLFNDLAVLLLSVWRNIGNGMATNGKSDETTKEKRPCPSFNMSLEATTSTTYYTVERHLL